MWPSCSRKKLRELSNLAPIDKAPFLLSFDVETVERSNYIVDRDEAHESGDQVEPSFFHSGGIDRRVSPRDRATSLASSPVFTTPCSLSPLPFQGVVFDRNFHAVPWESCSLSIQYMLYGSKRDGGKQGGQRLNFLRVPNFGEFRWHERGRRQRG